MNVVRTSVGFGLAGTILWCLWMEYITFLFITICLAVSYDTYCMKGRCSDKHWKYVLLFFVLMQSFNVCLLMLYQKDPWCLILVATITQLSDVYQFLGGKQFGNIGIGWISPNKTIEGYIVGWILTILTFYPPTLFWEFGLTFYNITIVYLLGIAGGLLSSWFKRSLKIKDYSDLLGPHGGWTDRIDSLVIPIILCLYTRT